MAEKSGLQRAFTTFAGWIRRHPSEPLPTPVVVPRPYVVRKQRLPNSFTERDWQRALDYWGHSCAVCGRPRGLWHTLAADHWIPLTAPDCPGTIPSNILPLCHGEGGCNNSKGKKMPEAWLKQKLGPRAAQQKQLEIDTYFLRLADQYTERLGCPKCGARVSYFEPEDLWLCNHCDAEWTTPDAREFARCPRCQCWMYPSQAEDGHFHCPRCEVDWNADQIPTPEICQGCGVGVLQWMYESDGPTMGWWHCPSCKMDWVFEWV